MRSGCSPTSASFFLYDLGPTTEAPKSLALADLEGRFLNPEGLQGQVPQNASTRTLPTNGGTRHCPLSSALNKTRLREENTNSATSEDCSRESHGITSQGTFGIAQCCTFSSPSRMALGEACIKLSCSQRVELGGDALGQKGQRKEIILLSRLICNTHNPSTLHAPVGSQALNS